MEIEEAELILRNTFTLSIIVSTLLILLGYIFIEPIMNLLGCKGNILTYAREYTNIFLLGTIFQIMGFSMNSIIRGQGNAKKAMRNFLAGIILNIILNPIFIFIFKMGIKGSALATVISIGVTSLCSIYPFLSKNNILNIQTKNLRLSKPIVLKILSIGTSGFIMQLTMCSTIIIFNIELLIYSTPTAVAVFGIINSLLSLIFMLYIVKEIKNLNTLYITH